MRLNDTVIKKEIVSKQINIYIYMYTHTHISGARKQGHNKQQKHRISLCNIEKKI